MLTRLALLTSLLASLIQPIAAANDTCSELKVGEKKISYIAYGGETTGIPNAQEIERTGERAFRISFNVSFYPGPSYPGLPPAISDLNANFRQKIQACLDKLNPRLKAKDNDGHVWKIELALSDPDSQVPQRKIQIVGPGISPMARWKTKDFERANDLAYPSDISCQTVVHELLHLGGLVDEYSETEVAPCRAIGPPTSVMRNEYLALGSTSPFPLQPAHVRALTYPGCAEKNAGYYHCALRSRGKEACSEAPECTLETGWLR
ncbi:MAG: hypothetical protein ACXWQO_00490 [Bdellovibrionota bacterium]